MYIRPSPPSWRRFVLQAEIYNWHLPDDSVSIDCDAWFVFGTRALISQTFRSTSRYILSHYFALDIRHRSREDTVSRFIVSRITYQHSHRNSARKLYANIVLTDYSRLSKALAQSRVGSAAVADPDNDCVSSRRADRGTGSRVPILVDLGRNARGRRSVEYTCRRRRRWGQGGRRQEGILFAYVRRRCTTTEVHGEPRCKESTTKKPSTRGRK